MASAETVKRTPIYPAHLEWGAKMIDFGGWSMPVQYGGILAEHAAVREKAGLFDISHMGEFQVTGAGGVEFLNELLTNDVAKLTVGKGQYTLMCNDSGGIIDDLFIYRTNVEEYLMVVNAACIEKDFLWAQTHKARECRLEDRSNFFAAVALQGPNSPRILERLIPGAACQVHRHAIKRFLFQNKEVWVARTGYTGEDGFELFFDKGIALQVWGRILLDGKDLGVCPCGLGARDTLRLEMGYPLNGSDLSETVTPFEAGIGFAVSLEKRQFVGKDSMARQKEKGLERKSAMFQMNGVAPPPRAHYPIQVDGRKIGEVTSGTQSPSLRVGIGMGLIEVKFAEPGAAIQVEIRGKSYPAVVAKKPLYKKETR
jgi:aminomethyltransferase